MKTLICFLWGFSQSDSSDFKYPFILQHPYAFFSLSYHWLLVSFCLFPKSINANSHWTSFVPASAVKPSHWRHVRLKTYEKQQKKPLQSDVRSVPPLRSTVCGSCCAAFKVLCRVWLEGCRLWRVVQLLFAVFSGVLTLLMAVVYFFGQITGSIDNDSLFCAARLIQQVGEICVCMTDHCRMRLCFPSDKSFKCLLKAARSTRKHQSIWLLYLKSLLFFNWP